MEYLNPPSQNVQPSGQTDSVRNAVDIQPAKAPSGPSLDIKALFFRLLRNWWLLLLGLVIGYGAAKLYLRYREIDYTVSAVVQISNGGNQEVSQIVVPNLTGIESGRNMQNEIELMKSRSLLLTVVEKLSIDYSTFSDGRVRNINLYKSSNNPLEIVKHEPVESAYGELLIVDVFEPNRFTFGTEENRDTFRFDLPFTSPYGRFLFSRNQDRVVINERVLLKFQDPVKVARSYADNLSIRPVGSTDLLEMSLEDEVPERAKDLINGIIEVYDSITVSVKNETTSRTIEFINERIGEFSEELATVEQRAENFIRDNDLLVDISTSLNMELTEFKETESQAAQIRIQLAAIDNLAEFLQQPNEDNQLIPFTAEVANLNVGSLISRYNQLLVDRQQLLTSGSTTNPVVLATQKPLEELEDNILNAITEIRMELTQELEKLSDRNSEILSSIQGVPRQRRELLGIEREQQIKEQLYVYLLQKREETGLRQAITVSGIRLVEPPITEGTNGPGSSQVYLVGLLIGLILPIGIVSARELLDNTIRTEEDVKSLTTAPLLATLAENKKSGQVVVNASSRTPIAEMFRMLRTNLRFLTAGQSNQTLLVTSSMSGEGKTFVCINLGVSLALAGHRVLMVGMDLRKPKMGKYLGLKEGDEQTKGISNYLVKSAELSEIIHQYEDFDNLSYITSGVIPPNPAEMIMLDRTKDMLRMLKNQYDYILIDTPPVALVTDALLLSDEADAVLFVTRYGVTKRRQLLIVDELRKEKKFSNIAVVLNGVKTGRGYGYGGYGYGYGYGYYHES